MNAREAVAYLAERGYPCSVGTLRALAKSKQLPCLRPGASGRGPMQFRPATLDLFLHKAEFGDPDEPIVVRKPPRERAPRAPKVKARVVANAEPDWDAMLRAEGGS